MAEAERRPRNWPANGRAGGWGLLVAGCRLQVCWRGRLWRQAVAAPEVFLAGFSYEVDGVERAGKRARWRRLILCYGMIGFHHGTKGALCGFNMPW